MEYYVYILRSLKDGRKYIGYTSDLIKRMNGHNQGLTPSTKNRKPFKLLCYKSFAIKQEATGYEKYLKRLKGGNQFGKEIEKMLKTLSL